MQCTSCRTTLQPGVTTCPSCGATISADTSPYETYDDTIPYIPYISSEERAPTEVEESVSMHVDSSSTGSATPQETSSSSSPELSTNAVIEPQPSLPTPQVPQPKQHRGLSASVTALLIILVLLLVGGGGGLTYYATVFHPAELHAQAIAVVQNLQAEATAQAAAINPQVLYAQVTSSKPAITDPLNNADNSIWLTTPSCTLTSGAYHASESTKNIVSLCIALPTDFQDAAFQVQMTILKGDIGGLMFRSSFDASNRLQGYFFGLDAAGGYQFLFTTPGGISPLRRDSNQAIATGLNQPNLITVIARGNKFYLYANKQFVTIVRDDTYTSGGIGLFAADLQTPTEIVFSNAQVWTL